MTRLLVTSRKIYSCREFFPSPTLPASSPPPPPKRRINRRIPIPSFDRSSVICKAYKKGKRFFTKRKTKSAY